jgi:hypothetical protein
MSGVGHRAHHPDGRPRIVGGSVTDHIFRGCTGACAPQKGTDVEDPHTWQFFWMNVADVDMRAAMDAITRIAMEHDTPVTATYSAAAWRQIAARVLPDDYGPSEVIVYRAQDRERGEDGKRFPAHPN